MQIQLNSAYVCENIPVYAYTQVYLLMSGIQGTTILRYQLSGLFFSGMLLSVVREPCTTWLSQKYQPTEKELLAQEKRKSSLLTLTHRVLVLSINFASEDETPTQ